jgi:hypothetical protein
MAIYTNYGRFLKAKYFKENLENNNDTYIVLGMGDPDWDSNRLSLPIAPYNSSITNRSGLLPDFTDSAEKNQFFDNRLAMYFISNSATVENPLSKYNTILPKFPCTWKLDESAEDLGILNVGGTPKISHKDDYYKYYIKKDGNDYKLCTIGTDNEETINYNSINDDVSREYFAELYLRGMAIENDWITTPGLLGAIKCKIEFVKDIGASETNYTGSLNQFYYGDRYWEVVPDADLAYYNEFEKEHGLDSESQLKDKVNFNYPTHLLISTLVNPGYLMQDLNFDQHLCARQIAICTSPKVTDTENKLTYYRAGDYIFNFGQYVAIKSGDSIHYEKPSTTDVYDASGFPNVSLPENKVLDFTLPYKFNDAGTILYPTEADLSTSAARKFNFILHDYILGNRRDAHSADRIGYVIGF